MIAAYTARDVRAAEEPLLASGPPGALMASAAFALATHVVRELRAAGRGVPGSRVLALVGGGNNGGDALHAAAFLARRGVAATAALLTAEAHAGGLAAARAAGVALVEVPDEAPSWSTLARLGEDADVWLDGIAGLGVRGGLREPVAGAVRVLAGIRTRRARSLVVVAVDTPSGIGVDDGTVPGAVLPADVTVAMGVAKPGLLLPPAADLAGRVRVVDIGLAAGLGSSSPAVLRLETPDVADLWPTPSPAAQKYERGVLGLLAGSARYPGAGALAAAGACRTGVGMVRYLGDPAVLRLVHAWHPEVVGAPGRVQAWVFGSGVEAIGEDGESLGSHMRAALAGGLPTVLDAGALALLSPLHPAHVDVPLSPRVVLTPHAGELAALLHSLGVRAVAGAEPTRADVEAAPLSWARRAAPETGATVLLKGPVTVVVGPDGPAYAQADATAWLATAGAGDVLAGVLGALLAGRSDDVQGDPALAGRLAAAAALVHGRAAREAADGGPRVAGDVARRMPATIRSVLAALPGRSGVGRP